LVWTVADLKESHDLSALTVEKIKLEKKLGNGAFGDVWLASMNTGEKVAVKMMTKEKVSALSIQRFKEEVKMARTAYSTSRYYCR